MPSSGPSSSGAFPDDPKAMTAVLVTGGVGFIGAAIVHRLVEEGHRVRVLDNLWRGSQRRLDGVANDVEFIESDIRDAMRHNDPSRINADQMGRVLGEEAAKFAKDLQRMMRELEESGFLQRGDHGLELTPKAMRKIGEKALTDIFKRMRGGAIGDHDREKTGIGVELTDETKRWEFGDELHLNTMKTVSNAVLRQGMGTPVHLKVEDFEIDHTISINMASTVIALDMSASMMWAATSPPPILPQPTSPILSSSIMSFRDVGTF